MSFVQYLAVLRCGWNGGYASSEILCDFTFSSELPREELYRAWMKDLCGNGDLVSATNRKPHARFHKSVVLEGLDGIDHERYIHWMGNAITPVDAAISSPLVEPKTLLYVAVVKSVNDVMTDNLMTRFKKAIFLNVGNVLLSNESPATVQQAANDSLLRVATLFDKDPKIDFIQSQLNDVKTQMADNVNAVLQNGEKLEGIESLAVELTHYSEQFQSRSRQVKRKMCFQAYKTYFIIAAIIIILVLVVIVPIAVSVKKASN